MTEAGDEKMEGRPSRTAGGLRRFVLELNGIVHFFFRSAPPFAQSARELKVLHGQSLIEHNR